LKEVKVNWNSVIRQVHRWLSIAFTAGVLIYVAVMSRGRPPGWVGLFPLLPLISLLVTGLYLFVLPYTVWLRNGRRAA
jgi:quinol-cytochrome oxidoreductase complex cytochrome b subunit